MLSLFVPARGRSGFEALIEISGSSSFVVPLLSKFIRADLTFEIILIWESNCFCCDAFSTICTEFVLEFD